MQVGSFLPFLATGSLDIIAFSSFLLVICCLRIVSYWVSFFSHYIAPPNASCITNLLMIGMDTRQVHVVAVKAMAMAANGNASSSFTKAAVPRP